jgi:predicted nucleotidyltransferase component of viral defense system
MLTLDQISQYLPPVLVNRNPRAAIVEYLQYELLDALFKHKEASALSFIGGTAIRILHNSPRFSEDLDFDNFSLSYADFETLLRRACHEMEYKGFIIELRFVEKGAYHCYIRFPEILRQAGLAATKDQKILIRVDTEAKEKTYEPRSFLLNRFTLYRKVSAAPPAILLSQKMLTMLQRKREKGRDIFDVSFLMGITQPDYEYLRKITSLEKDDFLKAFSNRLDELDFNVLARDVEPFLFDSDQKARVTSFKQYWERNK